MERRRSVLFHGTMLAGLLLPALAQSQESVSSTGVEEVVVTANRREEKVSDVPIAISAISGESLRNQNLRNATDLQYVVPNLNITSAYGEGRADLSIRGVTAVTANNFSDAAPVGVYSDEVFLSSREVQLTQLYDVERVEVLRGPQGTLFGRNTTGGALSYYSKLPTGTPGANYAQASAGNLGHYAVEGASDIELGGDWMMRVAAKHQSTDGYVTNVVDGKKFFGRESTGGRIILRRDTDALDLIVNVHGGKSEGDGRSYHPNGYGLGYYSLATRAPNTGDEQESFGASIKATVHLSAFDLVSVTGYETVDSYTRENFQYGLQYTGPNIYDVAIGDSHGEQWQLSQEVRLVSTNSENFTWVAGVFAFREHLDAFHDSGAMITHLPNGQVYSDQRRYQLVTDSYAVFGQATYRFTDKLGLTGGLRYTQDSKDLDWRFDSTRLASQGPLTRDQSWDATSGRVSLDYKFTPQTMSYVSYSRGFKSGTFNTAATNPAQLTTLRPETMNAYEVGLKTELGPRAQINAAAFYTEGKDFHAVRLTATPLGFLSLYSNAAEVESKGVEIEFSSRPVSEFLVRLTAAYLDAKFTNFVDGNNDYSGNSLPASSKYSGSLQLGYDFQLSNGAVIAPNVVTAYKSKQNTRHHGDPLDELPDRTLVDAQIRYVPAQGNWSASLWAKNLTNEEYAYKRYNNPGFLGAPGNILLPAPPRTYGVTAQYKW